MSHWRTSNVMAKLSYEAIVGFTNPIIHKISVDWRLWGYLNYFVNLTSLNTDEPHPRVNSLYLVNLTMHS